MTTSTMTLLQDSAQRMFPYLDFDQVLAQLLLERAQKNLINTAPQLENSRLGMGSISQRFGSRF